MQSQFDHSITYRCIVTKIARFHLSQPCEDSDTSRFVAKTIKPVGKWTAPILVLEVKGLKHNRDCSIKATDYG